MPLIQIFTSTTPDPSAGDALLRDLSSALARHFDKPEKWVMTCVVPGLSMTFGGTASPACFAVVKNIGSLTSEKATAISADLTARISKGVGVAPNRIYIEFTEAIGRLWGFDGDTFA